MVEMIIKETRCRLTGRLIPIPLRPQPIQRQPIAGGWGGQAAAQVAVAATAKAQGLSTGSKIFISNLDVNVTTEDITVRDIFFRVYSLILVRP